MTVGELRKALEGVPDEMEVVTEYDAGHFPVQAVTVIDVPKALNPQYQLGGEVKEGRYILID